MRALDDLVRQGHVRYVGVSNWSAWQIMKALGIAERRGLARFESLQAYTVAGRDLERELVPMLQSENVGLMVWSPLAGGLLSGKYGRDGGGDAGSRRLEFDFPPVDRDRAYDCVDVLRRLAEARGVSPAQMALAWLLAQPVVSSVIIGAKRVDQLDDNLAAVGLALTADELAELDKVSALPPEYPGWMRAPGRVPAPAVARGRPGLARLAEDARAPPFSGRCSSGSARPGSPGMGAARAPTRTAPAPDRKARPADRPRSRSPARPQAAPRGRHAPAGAGPAPVARRAARSTDAPAASPPHPAPAHKACDALLVTHEAHAPAAGPRA